ncbi:hypothetical protein LZ31DRAFT_64049 [Colletotrichum somersetense]|nr:hypothetical protein LZ31DRAFT_64049 [Colletotrichum somersetense]
MMECCFRILRARSRVRERLPEVCFVWSGFSCSLRPLGHEKSLMPSITPMMPQYKQVQWGKNRPHSSHFPRRDEEPTSRNSRHKPSRFRTVAAVSMGDGNGDGRRIWGSRLQDLQGDDAASRIGWVSCLVH